MGKIIGWIGIFMLVAGLVQAQSIQTDFGKNRIQYHDDFDHWDMYETANFVTYWYGKGREIAHTVVKLAELDNPSILSVLEHKMNDKIELIVYLDISDLKQTNLGLEEQFISQEGITKVIENKIFLHFNGDHNALRKSLREGIAHVYIQSMLHGSNLQEVVQNAVLLNLPDWFNEGLVSYMGEAWSPEIESQLQDYFTRPEKKRKDFARLARINPRLAGHAMWHYIASTYGQTSISNILYLTRINRSLENGLLYVLGIDSKQLGRQWESYFRSEFLQGENPAPPVRHDLDIVSPRKQFHPVRLRYSPDGRRLAYVINDHGRTRLILYDLDTGNKDVLIRHGVRNYEQQTDYNYPVFAWGPDGRSISVLTERRDVIFLHRYDLTTGDVFSDKLSPEYHRVYDMDYWSADTLMLNGTIDGYSDLFLYAPVTRQSVRMSHDFYDDLDATVVNVGGERGIVFASNRPNEAFRKMTLDSLLPIGPFDLFLLSWDGKKGSLRQLTFTPGLSERDPRMAGTDQLICRADVNGRWQRLRVTRLAEDPPVMTLHTQYDRDIQRQEYVPGAEYIIEVFEKFDKPLVQLTPFVPDQAGQPLDARLPAAGQAPSPRMPTPAEPEPDEPIAPGFQFQTPFPVPADRPVVAAPPPAPVEPVSDPEASDPELPFTPQATTGLGYVPGSLTPFYTPRIIAARLRFKLNYFNTTLDNNLLFGGLDSYAGEKREFSPQPMGLLVKASINDLLEDYIITGGARFPTTFNGSEYFLVLDNRKRRIDKQYAIYRKSVTENDPTGQQPFRRYQFVSVLGLSRWSYPFDTYMSVRMTATIRNDRTIALATERNSLREKTDDTQRIGLKAEWVFDNSRQVDINIRTGTRAKVWAEVVKRFDLNLFEEGKKFQFNQGVMTVLGLDARHYVSLDRRSVFATRLTAATSLGSERILYYLGGVENWMFPEYDRGTGVPNDINFAYTALAANMRGFKYNARNGSSVALLNTELRVPVFQYLSRQKIRSSFLRNTQVVGFLDVGTAWHGPDPFSPDNPLNTVVLTNPPTVEVIVNYYRNPMVVGYGTGLRTLLFGYLVKLDYAWNWETKTRQKPILHFSLGADF